MATEFKREKRAVALGFDINSASAPSVKARGVAASADKIIRIARRYGVSIHQEGQLLNKLQQIPVETEIPPELYDRVAEILIGNIKKD